MKVFRSPSLTTRVAALVALLVASGVVLGLGATVVAGIPRSYGAAQSNAACHLAERASEWSDFLSGTARDLLIFIPLYFVVCVAVVVVTSRRPAGRWTDNLFAGRVLSDGVALVLAVGGAAADVVETLIFRRTLEQLQTGRACPTLTTATDVTAAFTAVKWTLLATFVALVAARVLARPTAE